MSELFKTVDEAADILSVSREYLSERLNEGKIPFTIINAEQYICLEDLKRYKEIADKFRQRGLDELVAEAQSLDLY